VCQATIVMIDKFKLAAANLVGEVYASSHMESLNSVRILTKVINTRMLNNSSSEANNKLVSLINNFALSGVNSSHNPNLWLDTWTSSSELKDNKNATKTEISNMGMILGFDALLNEEATVGFMSGYEDGKVKVGNLLNSELKTSSFIFWWLYFC